jgi:serine phosphatase RsbU (regulator of sigma subunit)
VEFAGKMNEELALVMKAETSFATAVCGLVDLNKDTFRFASAGGPEVVLIHADGTYECLKVPVPLFYHSDYHLRGFCNLEQSLYL